MNTGENREINNCKDIDYAQMTIKVKRLKRKWSKAWIINNYPDDCKLIFQPLSNKTDMLTFQWKPVKYFIRGAQWACNTGSFLHAQKATHKKAHALCGHHEVQPLCMQRVKFQTSLPVCAGLFEPLLPPCHTHPFWISNPEFWMSENMHDFNLRFINGNAISFPSYQFQNKMLQSIIFSGSKLSWIEIWKYIHNHIYFARTNLIFITTVIVDSVYFL